MKGTLYLVPTPIGNLADMTYRGVEVLRDADVIACEDTRRTALLCTHYDIHTPLFSYHEHNKEKVAPALIARLEAGETVAVVSDAGMPAIADPGSDLVARWLAQNGEVTALPGANAGLTALIASGLSAQEFHFIGFLPRTAAKRDEVLRRQAQDTATQILYEAPHRLEETLRAVQALWGDRQAVLARELTKKFETYYRGRLGALRADETVQSPRGEYVLLVAGAAPAEDTPLTPDEWPQAVRDEMARGLMYKEACRRVAARAGVSRRDVYGYCLDKTETREDK